MPITTTQPKASFFNWLNAPVDTHPLQISNLMAYIYSIRYDLQQAFPNSYGLDRFEFLNWFVTNAFEHYKLNTDFTWPVQINLESWANQTVEQHELPLTNLAIAIYNKRPDLQQAFGDIYTTGRTAYHLWFVENAATEYGLTEDFIEPVRARLQIWANTLYSEDKPPDGLPQLTNLAIYLYQSQPNLQRDFPDVYGEDRIAYIFWLLQKAKTRYNISADFFLTLQESFLAWSIQPEPAVSANSGLPVSRLAWFIYQSRPDLQQIFPSLDGHYRLDYLLWLIGEGQYVYNLEPVFVASLLASLA